MPLELNFMHGDAWCTLEVILPARQSASHSQVMHFLHFVMLMHTVLAQRRIRICFFTVYMQMKVDTPQSPHVFRYL